MLRKNNFLESYNNLAFARDVWCFACCVCVSWFCV